MASGFPLTDRADHEVLFRLPLGAPTAITAAAFLSGARALAARLPDGRYLVNTCRDRYAFAVAFAAGLIASRTALLNVDPARLDELAHTYPGCSVITDTPIRCTLPMTQVSPPLPGQSRAPPPIIDADQLAAIVFTSGSTGEPVPHPKRWGALVTRSRAAAAAFGLDQHEGGTIIGTVPPQHMYGFELTVLLPLHSPVSSWCGPAFFPGDVAAALASCPAPGRLVTTPLHLRALLQSGMPLPLATIISATAPLHPALATQAETAWGGDLHEIFGATECGSIASRRTTQTAEWTAYPGVEVNVGLDADGAVIAAPFMPPVGLADVLEPTPAGFRLLGRRTDLIKLGGRRASLPGLNQILTGLAGVDDGAFVMPEDLNERTARLVAVVVAPGRTAPGILADLRLLLDPVFMPRRVIRVERLPRNDLGKLPRQALLQLLAEAAA